MTVNKRPNQKYIVKNGKVYKRILSRRLPGQQDQFALIEVTKDSQRVEILLAKGYTATGREIKCY